jgi:hypothetical protein
MYDHESEGQLCQRWQPERWAKVTGADERIVISRIEVTRVWRLIDERIGVH